MSDVANVQPTGAPALPLRSGTAARQGLAESNALPPGMRDLLPPEAQQQSRVGRRLAAAFDAFGYERVWLPMFEYAAVIERSRTAEGESVKFVEPESGEIVALRSDMTPQIARVVSTRYVAAPDPIRLCYQGSVLRRRRERARTESQVVQAGVELLGKPGIDGDFEVLSVLCRALTSTRLDAFVLDLGHSAIGAELLALAAPEYRQDLREALQSKDVAGVAQIAARARLDVESTAALVELPELCGGEEIWPRAEKVLVGTPAAPHLAEAKALFQRCLKAQIAPQLSVDLGETPGVDYYTGVVFQALAQGPGEPIASGGRYDSLYAKFGHSKAAAGFAIDLNALGWALRAAGIEEAAPKRLVADAQVPVEVLNALRAQGISCCVAERPRDYATFWRYDYVLETGAARSEAQLVATQLKLWRSTRGTESDRNWLELASLELTPKGPGELGAQLASLIGNVAAETRVNPSGP